MQYQEFMSAPQKNVPHVCLLAGTESYFIERAKTELWTRLFGDAKIARENVETLSAETKARELAARLQEMPNLFTDTGKNVFFIRDSILFSRKKDDEKGEAWLLETLGNMPSTSYLVFELPQKADMRQKICRAIQHHGLILEANPLRTWAVAPWLDEHLREMGTVLTSAARAYFLGAVSLMPEVSLAYLDRELQKLLLYAKGNRISKDTLIALFAGTPEISSFALADAISEKDAHRALFILRQKKEDGTSPLLLIVLLARHTRQLWQARFWLRRGFRGRDLSSKMNLSPFITGKIARASQRFSEITLRKAFLTLVEADWQEKTGQGGTALLEEAILRLCVKETM